jgi:hypothetical protein
MRYSADYQPCRDETQCGTDQASGTSSAAATTVEDHTRGAERLPEPLAGEEGR